MSLIAEKMLALHDHEVALAECANALLEAYEKKIKFNKVATSRVVFTVTTDIRCTLRHVSVAYGM